MLQEEDLEYIKKNIGKNPNAVEKELFLNIWSEHCSYKSSKLLLENFKTDGENIIIGPGDDAAVIKFNNELVISIAMESHNHPSYIDPYEGAATGVGGIIRDILSMGTNPIAFAPLIYLGNPTNSKNKWLLKNIINGSKDYSTGINIKALRCDSFFDNSYNENPLVNVIAIGIGKKENVVTSKSKKEFNKLIIYGSRTSKEGLGGASFASNSISDKSSNLVSLIPKGNPSLEKKIIDATLESINENIIESCRDLGAAGIAGATSELSANGKLGAIIDISNIKLEDNTLNICEILLSETQERMLVEVKENNIKKFEDIMNKYNLEWDIIGYLINKNKYIIKNKDDIIVDLPIMFLVNGVIKRKLKSSNPYNKTTIYNGLLKSENEISKELLIKFLSSINFISEGCIKDNYIDNNDKNTDNRNYIEEGILKITESEGIILSCICDPYLSYINPYNGIKISIIKNIIRLAIKGSKPLCLVNNLNFCDPNDPEQYWFLEQTTLGLSDISKELDFPIVGGNVSLYNESKEYNNKILPTAALGMVGKIDFKLHIPNDYFISENDTLYLIGPIDRNLVGSEFYRFKKIQSNEELSLPINYNELISKIKSISQFNYITTINQILRGGLIVSLSKMIYNYGVMINLKNKSNEYIENILFSESPLCIIVSTNNSDKFENYIKNEEIQYLRIGTTIKEKKIILEMNDNENIEITKGEIENINNSFKEYIK